MSENSLSDLQRIVPNVKTELSCPYIVRIAPYGLNKYSIALLHFINEQSLCNPLLLLDIVNMVIKTVFFIFYKT